MMIEERIEKAKKRIAKALHNIRYAADALLKQNAKLEKECLDLNNVQNHMKSSIASLEAENAAISEKLEEIRSKIDNKNQVLQTGLAIEVKSEQQSQSSSTVNAEPELRTLPDTLVDKSTSEYIDVSINQLKRLLKQKINK